MAEPGNTHAQLRSDVDLVVIVSSCPHGRQRSCCDGQKYQAQKSHLPKSAPRPCRYPGNRNLLKSLNEQPEI
jgi:uncharacterized protein YcgI (DUF1989 family)